MRTLPKRWKVTAQLTCGHIVEMPELTKDKAERALAAMETSAFCDRCWKMAPTKHRFTEPTLPI